MCVSGNLSKSVDFVIAVTEKLQPFLSAGFTFVVAKRFFRDADLLVTEKHTGSVNVDLDLEQINDPKWSNLYTNIGNLTLNPRIRQKLSGEQSREKLEEHLVSYASQKIPSHSTGRFRTFLSEENIGIFEKPEDKFSSSAYESAAKEGVRRPKESDYGKWEITDYDREGLRNDFENYIETKQKKRIRLLAVLGVFTILIAVVVIFFVNPGLFNPGLNSTEYPHITPSATIEPGDTSLIVTQLSTPPGNIPGNLSGFGSAYEITLYEPQNVTLNLHTEYNPDLSYYVLCYNQQDLLWEPLETQFEFTNDTVTAFIPNSGIYRFFTDKESVYHAN